jgi:hypothetical protein
LPTNYGEIGGLRFAQSGQILSRQETAMTGAMVRSDHSGHPQTRQADGTAAAALVVTAAEAAISRVLQGFLRLTVLAYP